MPGPALLSPVVWVQQYGAQQLSSSAETLGFGPEAATALSADSAGNVVVGGYVAGSFAGFSGNPGVIDAYLAKYGPDGTKLWLQQFPSPLGALVAGVATDSANNIVAVGSKVASSAGRLQIFATKLDPSGNPIWYVDLPADAGSTFGEQVKFEADGSIIVAGYGFFNGSSGETLFVAKLSGVDGHIQWVTPYAVPGMSFLTALALDPNGNPLVAGMVSVSNSTYPVVAKLNQADGSIAWATEITTVPDSMIPFSVTSDASGNPIVGGSVSTSASTSGISLGFCASSGEQGVIYKFSGTDGSQQWTKTYSTGKGDSITGIQSIADGTIYATGYTNGHFDYETEAAQNTVFFLTLTSDGIINSAHQFGTGALLNTTAPFGPLTTIDPNGNVFVSGATTGAYTGFANGSHVLQMFVAKLKPAPLLKY